MLNLNLNEEAAPPITGVVRDLAGAAINGATVTNKVTKNRCRLMRRENLILMRKKEMYWFLHRSVTRQKEIKVGGYNEVGVVQLVVSKSKLDEVQIIAYGKTTQRLSTE